jgi:hypothetical protein
VRHFQRKYRFIGTTNKQLGRRREEEKRSFRKSLLASEESLLKPLHITTYPFEMRKSPKNDQKRNFPSTAISSVSHDPNLALFLHVFTVREKTKNTFHLAAR